MTIYLLFFFARPFASSIHMLPSNFPPIPIHICAGQVSEKGFSSIDFLPIFRSSNHRWIIITFDCWLSSPFIYPGRISSRGACSRTSRHPPPLYRRHCDSKPDQARRVSAENRRSLRLLVWVWFHAIWSDPILCAMLGLLMFPIARFCVIL